MAGINGTYRVILGNEVVKTGEVEKSFESPTDYLNHLEKVLNSPSYVDNIDLSSTTPEVLTGETVGDFEDLGAGDEFPHILFHYQDGGMATKEYDLHVYVTVETER